MHDVVGCDAARTPIGRFGDSLTKVRARRSGGGPEQGVDGVFVFRRNFRHYHRLAL